MTGDHPLGGASPSLALALAARFLLELALLAGAAATVWLLVPGWGRWPAALLAVVVVAALWGLLLSPRAVVPLPGVTRLLVEAALFLGVGAGLLLVGLGVAAAIGVVLWMLDRIALALLPRRAAARPPSGNEDGRAA